uniref:Uncharacterized protein n=1 Tax=Magnetococcus massalia (strain MO-1) TaxID=451514 RepID=A0A1S7LQ41_MAGMO|nr:protein of unknown function [Candidatus Magnetococcus massalia]
MGQAPRKSPPWPIIPVDRLDPGDVASGIEEAMTDHPDLIGRLFRRAVVHTKQSNTKQAKSVHKLTLRV